MASSGCQPGAGAYREAPILETDQSQSGRWERWRHGAVRDLAWVLASPPLLRPSDKGVRWLNTAWGERAFRASEEWLEALDRHPAPLLDSLSRRNDHRLGSHFEALLAFWLGWPGNPLYRLVGHNLAVRSNNRTLGELDFLVEERQSGELQHWEVAVKFYLGVAPGGDHAHWIGPGLKDRLDLKVDRLTGHQLALSRRPEGAGLIRHLGLPAPTPVCLLKGRLFYPAALTGQERSESWAPLAANPGHLQGWWMPQDDFLRQHAGDALRWIRLPKQHWLTRVVPTSLNATVTIGDAQSADDFVEGLRQSADNRAAAVIGLSGDSPHDFREVTRGFITPAHWPQLPDSA